MSKKSSGRQPSAAFMKPMTPSPALSEVVGDKPLPRTEVTKKLWAYIKRNNLQDKKNRRMIHADDALKTEEVGIAMKSQTIDPIGSSPQEFGDFIRKDQQKWSALLEATGLLR